MAQGHITVTVDGEQQMHAWLSRFTDTIKDFRPIWPDIAREFWAIQKEQFDSHGHGNWAPLSPRYAAWKAQHYPGQGLLVREGTLRNAATGGTGHTMQEAPNTLELGWKVAPYWIFHQRGTGRMPRRKVIDLREEDKIRIMKTFHRSVLAAMGRIKF